MATDFHDRVRELVEEASRIEPSLRRAYVEGACDDPRVRAEVLSLLPHFERMDGFEPQQPGGTDWKLPGTTIYRDAKRDAEERAARRDPQPPFDIAQFRVIETLGCGGMGIVYKATVSGVPEVCVAIKVLRGDVLTQADLWRFRFEEELLRHLQHPGMARMLQAGVARLPAADAAAAYEERPYFVMEYIDGLPLTRHAEARALGLRERLELLLRVCDAVEYAHRRGIIHRDLKPDNILVDARGQPRILDFGISQLVAFETGALRESDGYFTGTLAYASPEQRAGQNRTLTPASDVYTLALIVHELLTGHLPAYDEGVVQIDAEALGAAAAGAVTPGSEAAFRDELSRILARALRKTGTDAFRTAGDLAACIEELLAYVPAASRWMFWKRRLAAWFESKQDEDHASATRALSAVLRKRIELAIRSDVLRDEGGRAGPREPGDASTKDRP